MTRHVFHLFFCVFQWFLILPIWRKVLRICKKLKIFSLLLRQKSSCHFSAFFTRPGIESILVNYFFLYSTTMWLFFNKKYFVLSFPPIYLNPTRNLSSLARANNTIQQPKRDYFLINFTFIVWRFFLSPQKFTKERTVDYNIFPKTNKHFL